MKQANVRHFVAPSSPGRKQLPRGAGSRETQQEGYSLCASWETICRETGRTEGTALRAILSFE